MFFNIGYRYISVCVTQIKTCIGQTSREMEWYRHHSLYMLVINKPYRAVLGETSKVLPSNHKPLIEVHITI